MAELESRLEVTLASLPAEIKLEIAMCCGRNDDEYAATPEGERGWKAHLTPTADEILQAHALAVATESDSDDESDFDEAAFTDPSAVSDADDDDDGESTGIDGALEEPLGFSSVPLDDARWGGKSVDCLWRVNRERCKISAGVLYRVRARAH